MKKLFLMFVLMIPFISLAENFEMGTIEVSDVKAKMNAKSFEKKNKSSILDEKEKNISIGMENPVFQEKKAVRNPISVVKDEKTSYGKLLIGNESYNFLEVNYNQKDLNYLWNGNFISKTYDVTEVNGDNSYWKLGIDYDDIWESISFSSESFISNHDYDTVCAKTVPTNFYSVEEDILDLSSSVYFTKIKDWNFFGRIAKYEKKIAGAFAGAYNNNIENSVFDVKAYRQMDFSEKSFLDLTVNIKRDSLKATGVDVDNNRFDILADYNIMEKDHSIIARLGLYNSDDEDETAIDFTYNMYKSDKKTMRFAFGNKYTPYNYEKVLFAKDVVKVAGANVLGELSSYFEGGYTFVYRGVDLEVVLGQENIDNKYYYTVTAANDNALTPMRFADIDNTYFGVKAEYVLAGGDILNFSYRNNSYEFDVPFESENIWNVMYSTKYNENILIDLNAEFTGEYKDSIGGTKNANFLVVDLDMSYVISDKLRCVLNIENLLDKDYTKIPGFNDEQFSRKINLGMIMNF